MSLFGYLEEYLGDFGTEIGLTSGTYNFMVSETLEKLSISSESDVDPYVLHTVGKYVAWDTISVRTSGDVNYKTDGESFNLAEAHDHAVKMRDGLFKEALPYLGNFEIKVSAIRLGGNPYNEISVGDL